jgi:hypothetical protein
MTAGVCLWLAGGWLLDAANEPKPPTMVNPTQPPQGYVAGRIVPSVLHGPNTDIAMPPAGRSVIHVWLQGCADCMPAFEAMRVLDSAGGLRVRVPVVNVAYGEADVTWATRYGVSHNLVFDQGGASVVKPLGIGSFTTLVVDTDGTILLRDRPDRAGYLARVRAAVGAENLEPEPPPEDNPQEGVQDTNFDSAAVARVVDAHRAEVKRRCWDQMGEAKTSTSVVVRLSIGTNGHVESSSTSGDDPAIAKCIELQIRGWVFPPPTQATTVNIPFKFIRQ